MAEETAEEAAEETAEVAAAEEIEEPAAPEQEPEPQTIETSDADTLLDIAQQVRPDASVTLQQTMLAIQALNPDAFIDDNINRMRSGQVLRVPDREEIAATDAASAAAEVVRQNQEFADIQPLAAPAQDQPEQEDTPQGQLSVITADADAIDATAGAGGLDDEQNAELDRRIAELENQLALRQEEADRARIEREELDSRLADLEAQIEASQEIIRLQDLQLAQLQESLAQAAAEAEAAAAEEAALVAAQTEIEAAQVQPSASGGLVNDIMRILTGNTMMMLFGVATVILLLVFLLLRRNRAAAVHDEEELDELAEQEFGGDTEAGAEAETATAIESSEEADLDQELDEILAVGDSDDEITADSSDAAEVEEGALATADVLIQHEKLEQAAGVLREALEQDPADHELRLKLVEVLALQDDLAAFEEQADIIAQEQSPVMDREVDRLREKLTGQTEESADDAVAAFDDEDAGLEFEAAADAAEPELETTESAAEPAEIEDEDDTASFLDDLGIDLDAFDSDEFEFSDEIAEAGEEEEESSESAEEASLDDDLDMTFDLGAIEEPETEDPETDEPEAGSEEEAATTADESAEVAELDADAGVVEESEADEVSIFDEIDSESESSPEEGSVLDLDEESDGDQEEKQEEKEEEADKESEAADDATLFETDDTVLELDADTENSELTSGSAKDADELEIDAFEFDAEDFKTESEPAQQAEDDEELDLETFAFDTDDIPSATAADEPEPAAVEDDEKRIGL